MSAYVVELCIVHTVVCHIAEVKAGFWVPRSRPSDNLAQDGRHVEGGGLIPRKVLPLRKTDRSERGTQDKDNTLIQTCHAHRHPLFLTGRPCDRYEA